MKCSILSPNFHDSRSKRSSWSSSTASSAKFSSEFGSRLVNLFLSREVYCTPSQNRIIIRTASISMSRSSLLRVTGITSVRVDEKRDEKRLLREVSFLLLRVQRENTLQGMLQR